MLLGTVPVPQKVRIHGALGRLVPMAVLLSLFQTVQSECRETFASLENLENTKKGNSLLHSSIRLP